MSWDTTETMRILKSQPGTAYQEADQDLKVQMRIGIKRLLATQGVTVEFVKADGTVRQMNCTLNQDLIPAAAVRTPVGPVDGIVKESKQRQPADQESCRVFDLDKQEWRSFRYDRLKKFTVEMKFE